MERRNPFEYGPDLALDELVDREEELAEVAATIRNRQKLFLIGPRRFGKTSLLSAADEIATSRGAVVVRLDAEKYESLELKALERAQIIRVETELGDTHFRLVDPFLAEWIRVSHAP